MERMNEFARRLRLKVPLIVAPMAGGPSSVEFVAASAEAGALGSVGAAYSTGTAIGEFVAAVRKKTANPIAVNLFIPGPEPVVTAIAVARAREATEPFRRRFGLESPPLQAPYEIDFDEQFEATLRAHPEVFTFVFGLLKPEYIGALRKEKILIIGTATTPTEAEELAETGVDAITLQGIEAGGHRGIFDPAAADQEIPLARLLDECQGKIKIPLIAAGGLMTSIDIKQALAAGAAAVQLGTAFLACAEAGTSSPYRRALLASALRRTKTTRAFSGRLARGLENEFMREIDARPEAILPFQAQNQFTRDLRAASLKADSADCLSLWAGTGEGALWTGPVKDLISQLF